MIYDVVIAGAGPVGSFLACELQLAGVSVRLNALVVTSQGIMLDMEKIDFAGRKLLSSRFRLFCLSFPEGIYFSSLYTNPENCHKQISCCYRGVSTAHFVVIPQQSGGICFALCSASSTSTRNLL